MKTKKFVSALLALVMVLSILPMAVFAAEEEHTHDETCGCVSTLAVCIHDLVQTGVVYEYDEITSVSHTRHSYKFFRCSKCNEPFLDNQAYSVDVQGHDSSGGKVYAGITEDQGESYYQYNCTCACGYEWVLLSAFPPA